MELGVLYPGDRKEGAIESMGWFQVAISLRPTNPAAWYNLGVSLHHHGDLNGAIAAFREALKHDGNGFDPVAFRDSQRPGFGPVTYHNGDGRFLDQASPD